MGLYNKLPKGLTEIDVIIAGGPYAPIEQTTGTHFHTSNI